MEVTEVSPVRYKFDILHGNLSRRLEELSLYKTSKRKFFFLQALQKFTHELTHTVDETPARHMDKSQSRFFEIFLERI